MKLAWGRLMNKNNLSFFIRKNSARILIGLVTFFNLQCAVVFLFNPGGFAPAFELNGYQGQVVISSLGILFLMWNVPYLFALYNPLKNRTSLIQAVIMQTVGFAGESLLWLNAPTGHNLMQASILRFMVFDGLGLILLLAAFLLVRNFSK